MAAILMAAIYMCDAVTMAFCRVLNYLHKYHLPGIMLRFANFGDEIDEKYDNQA